MDANHGVMDIVLVNQSHFETPMRVVNSWVEPIHYQLYMAYNTGLHLKRIIGKVLFDQSYISIFDTAQAWGK